MIPGIHTQMRRDFQHMLADPQTGTAIAFHYSTPRFDLPGSPPEGGYDPQDESTWPAGREEHVVEMRGIVHESNPAPTGFHRFAEIAAGDLIVDLPADAAIDGKDHPRFEINGQFFVQKHAGEKLSRSWAIRSERGLLFRTVLLTLAE